MAYGSSSTISYLGAMACGAMADGLGFAPATQSISNQLTTAASSFILKTNTAIAGGSSAVESLCASDALGYGAFTGVVPSAYSSSVGAGYAPNKIGDHGNLMFGASPVQMAQTFFAAESLASMSENLAPTLNKLDQGVNFGKLPSLDRFVYPADGVFPNYLGMGYPDYQAVVTNGVSTLVTEPTVENFALLASDLDNLGTAYNLEDIANFGNPGQIIASINNADAISATGLDVVLARAGIDPDLIYSLGNPTYNEIMQNILNSITLPELISNAQTLLGTRIGNMKSLGDYTNFDKIFVQSRNIISFNNMTEFAEKLQAIELGRIETLEEFADYIRSIEPATLPQIDNRTEFTQSTYINSLIAKFLGGTGPNNSITLVDIIGSLGGVIVKGYATEWVTAMNNLYTAGTLTALGTRLQELINGQNGDYTTGSSPTFTITDPNGGATYGPSADPYPLFEAAKISQIESEVTSIISSGGDDVEAVQRAWRLMLKKIRDEIEFQSRVDMGYTIRTTTNDNAYSFITGLRGNIYEYEQNLIINGMVDQAIQNGDIGGEYVRAYIKELENKVIADGYDIRWRAEFDE